MKATIEDWKNPERILPCHKELVLCHIGAGSELDPFNCKVAEYDMHEDCFVFGEADGCFANYAMYGFVRSEVVSGWMPLHREFDLNEVR